MQLRQIRRKIAENFGDSVVKIRASIPNDKTNVGTGFFVSEDGVILTCNHIISYFETQNGGLVSKYSSDIKVDTKKWGTLTAKIIHNLTSTYPLLDDYAILKVDVNNSRGIPLCDPNALQPGDDILVLGHPFGLPQLCVTSGIVSTKYQGSSLLNTLISLDLIRIDGSINKGNSGGPLIDLFNEMAVGIVSLRIGHISEQIERLKKNNNVPAYLIEAFEASNNLINVGIGEAISIRYALTELRGLNINLP
jgi:serine protease Do